MTDPEIDSAQHWLSVLHRIGFWAVLLVAVGVVLEFVEVWLSRPLQKKIDDWHEEKIAHLQRDAAAANERAVASELKLEQLRRQVAPRQIQRGVFLKAIEGQPQSRVEIVYLRDDPECFDVAQQLWQLLREAKWNVTSPTPIPVIAANTDLQNPTAMSVDGQPSGVTVIAESISEEEAEVFTKGDLQGVKTPFLALTNALLKSLGAIGSHAGGPHKPSAGTLRVVIAPR